jgi:hypothetical protein
MTFQEALTIVQHFGAVNHLGGLLEILEFMNKPHNREEMTGQELRAHRVVCNDMSKLFA